VEIDTDSAKAFLFPKIPAGDYVLEAYKDRDENGRFFNGNAFPYKAPEPFGILRDTIRVRARWETKGVVIPVR
jgi:uncharacterized protein (DUF2141 family)